MWRVEQRAKVWILPAIVALVLLYTADQLLSGERGIVTWRVMKTQLQALRAENQALRDDIANLEMRIARMRPDEKGRVDVDFMDELVRRDLSLLRKGEVVILTGQMDEK